MNKKFLVTGQNAAGEYIKHKNFDSFVEASEYMEEIGESCHEVKIWEYVACND